MKIRRVENQPSLRDRLRGAIEQRAREICDRDDPDPTHPMAVTRGRLDLCLAELDGMNAVAETQDRSLVRQECYARTELHHMEQRTPRYSPYRFPEREKLQRRLIRIEEERRRLLRERHQDRQDLMGRIHELVSQAALLES